MVTAPAPHATPCNRARRENSSNQTCDVSAMKPSLLGLAVSLLAILRQISFTHFPKADGPKMTSPICRSSPGRRPVCLSGDGDAQRRSGSLAPQCGWPKVAQEHCDLWRRTGQRYSATNETVVHQAENDRGHPAKDEAEDNAIEPNSD